MIEVGRMMDPPRYVVQCSSCDVAAYVMLDESGTAMNRGVRAKTWRPRYCSHCGAGPDKARDNHL